MSLPDLRLSFFPLAIIEPVLLTEEAREQERLRPLLSASGRESMTGGGTASEDWEKEERRERLECEPWLPSSKTS